MSGDLESAGVFRSQEFESVSYAAEIEQTVEVDTIEAPTQLVNGLDSVVPGVRVVIGGDVLDSIRMRGSRAPVIFEKAARKRGLV
jgi:hypothetical protein